MKSTDRRVYVHFQLPNADRAARFDALNARQVAIGRNAAATHGEATERERGLWRFEGHKIRELEGQRAGTGGGGSSKLWCVDAPFFISIRLTESLDDSIH